RSFHVFFLQAEDGIRAFHVTGVQTCALPISVGFEGHVLGTDETGRDMLSRLLHGGRLSLLSGLVPVVFALLIGGTLGILAGFLRSEERRVGNGGASTCARHLRREGNETEAEI